MRRSSRIEGSFTRRSLIGTLAAGGYLLGVGKGWSGAVAQPEPRKTGINPYFGPGTTCYNPNPGTGLVLVS